MNKLKSIFDRVSKSARGIVSFFHTKGNQARIHLVLQNSLTLWLSKIKLYSFCPFNCFHKEWRSKTNSMPGKWLFQRPYNNCFFQSRFIKVLFQISWYIWNITLYLEPGMIPLESRESLHMLTLCLIQALIKPLTIMILLVIITSFWKTNIQKDHVSRSGYTQEILYIN